MPPAVAALTTVAEPTIAAPAHTANTAVTSAIRFSGFISILYGLEQSRYFLTLTVTYFVPPDSTLSLTLYVPTFPKVSAGNVNTPDLSTS